MRFLESLLSQQQIEQLILAFVEGAEAGEAAEAEIANFLEWCDDVALNHYLVQLCAQGKMLPRRKREVYSFKAKEDWLKNPD